MKKERFFFFFAWVIFAAACRGCASSDDMADQIRDYYNGLTSMKLQAAVIAEFDDYAVEFELSFSYESQGESYIEVKKPVEIEGVKVISDENGMSLEYEGTSFEAALPEDTVISPAAVLPELFRVWSEGIVFEQGSEKLDGTDCLMLVYRSKQNETEILYRTWFDRSSLRPLKADVFANGIKKMDCEFLIAENFK